MSALRPCVTGSSSISRARPKGSKPIKSSRKSSPKPRRPKSSLSVLDILKRVSEPISRISRRPAPLEEEELFDDDFQRKLDYLAVVSRRVFAGRLRAERRT